MQTAFRAMVFAAVAMCGSRVWAQPATTVQLPTFRVFTVLTSVSVPDSGGATLGGIKTARDFSSRRGFGPLKNRDLATERAGGGVSVHATIIDHKALDDALLAEAAAKRGTTGFDPTAMKAELLSRHIGRAESPPPLVFAPSPPVTHVPVDSVAAIKARNAAAAEARSSEAADYFAKARQAEVDAKPGVAKVYYQMVLRRDSDELKRLAQGRLQALDQKSARVANR